MKVCIVSSCGGHLTEVRSLRSEYSRHEHFYVLNDVALLPRDMEGRTRFIRHSERDWLTLLNLYEAWAILRSERPDLILSTGAGPAVPFSLVGKLLGVPTVFIESFARIREPSLTGKIMYRLADRFFYQWRSLRSHFPRGTYGGPIFAGSSSEDEYPPRPHPRAPSGPPFVFVTLGNATQGFPRLLEAVDRLAGAGGFGEREVFLQTGNTAGFHAAHCRSERFLPMERFHEMIRDADLVVSHAGAGTLFHVLEAGKVPVVMPRRKRHGEHVDDHQVELVQAMSEEDRVVAVYDAPELPGAVATALRRAGQPALHASSSTSMRSQIALAMRELAP
jgi:UDP-N-acetylglucosamine transferase subunit ALG13